MQKVIIISYMIPKNKIRAFTLPFQDNCQTKTFSRTYGTTCTCSSSTPYLSRTTYIYLRNTCGTQYRVHYRLSNTFLFHPPFISRIHYNLINYSNLESTLSLSLLSPFFIIMMIHVSNSGFTYILLNLKTA